MIPDGEKRPGTTSHCCYMSHQAVCCTATQLIVMLADNLIVGRDSSVCTATRYGLDVPGIESRRVMRSSAPIRTGPGAHTASCTMGTGSFPGVKRPGRGVDNPPHLAPSLKSRAIALLPLLDFVVCYREKFTFTFTYSLSIVY